MYLKGILIFCLVVVHEPLFCYGKFAMADDPILKHLQMEPETEYEFLGKDFLHQLEKRDLHGRTRVKIYTKDESIDLLLYPRNSTLAASRMPLYFAKKNITKRGGIQYYLNKDNEKNDDKSAIIVDESSFGLIMRSVSRLLLNNPVHLASLIINKDEDGRSTVNGVIRSKRHDAFLVIRSLPDSVVQEHLRKRRSTNASVDEDLSQSQHHTNHVILKIKDGTAFEKLHEVHQAPSKVHRYMKRDLETGLKRTLYLRLLIHLDSTYFDRNYSTYQDLGILLLRKRRELISLMEYVFAFWNSVELPYRNLENPTIQFNIGTIVMAPSVEATPYITKSKNSTTGRIDHHAALRSAEHFYYKVRDQISLKGYDLVITMTKLRMSGTVAGAAISDSICSDPDRVKKQEAVAVIQDSYGFNGIHAAMHEVGHALGLHHDGYGDPSCHGRKGFIMAALDFGMDKSSLFSPCSLSQLRKALREEKFMCLYNRPTLRGKSLPLLAAGKIFNMDQQCQALNYTKACGYHTENFCRRLSCHLDYTEGPNWRIENCESLFAAAPGTSCDTVNDEELGICFLNRCVADNQSDEESEMDL